MYNAQQEHIQKQASFECPECREREIRWKAIKRDIDSFEKKLAFSLGEGTSVLEKERKDIENKVLYIFKCPISIDVEDKGKGKEEKEEKEDKGKGKEEKIPKIHKRKRETGEVVYDIREVIVNDSSWKKFMLFIQSKSDLYKLSQPTLLELCRSLEICKPDGGEVSARETKTSIINKLIDYFISIEPSLRLKPNVVPYNLMTVYCSNPQLFCNKEGIPQNLDLPEAQSAYLAMKRRRGGSAQQGYSQGSSY